MVFISRKCNINICINFNLEPRKILLPEYKVCSVSKLSEIYHYSTRQVNRNHMEQAATSKGFKSMFK